MNNGASSAYKVLPKSAIYVIDSHGAPGLIQLGTDDNISVIGANIYSGGNNRSISDLSANALSNTKLVLYAGCSTGVTSSSYGNLVTKTRAKGAKCVVGWNNEITCGPTVDWIRLLFEKASDEHAVLWECFNHADYWVEDIWGTKYKNELNNRNEAGDVTQYLYK